MQNSDQEVNHPSGYGWSSWHLRTHHSCREPRVAQEVEELSTDRVNQLSARGGASFNDS